MRANRKTLREEYQRSLNPPFVVNNEIAYVYPFKELKYMVSWDKREDKPESILGRLVSVRYATRFGYDVREAIVEEISNHTKNEILEDILEKRWSPLKKDTRKSVSYKYGNKKVTSRY